MSWSDCEGAGHVSYCPDCCPDAYLCPVCELSNPPSHHAAVAGCTGTDLWSASGLPDTCQGHVVRRIDGHPWVYPAGSSVFCREEYDEAADEWRVAWYESTWESGDEDTTEIEGGLAELGCTADEALLAEETHGGPPDCFDVDALARGDGAS